MGIRLIAEVMDHAPATLTHREAWVLGVLAADANDDTRTTWNSIEAPEILHRARVSRQQMYAVISSLIAKQALERTTAGQRNAIAKYRVRPLAPSQCPQTQDPEPGLQGSQFPDTDASQCPQNPDAEPDSQRHIFPDTEISQRPEIPDTDASQCPQIPDPYSLKIREKDLSHPAATTEAFDAWWVEYPRKVAKATARKAFIAAVKAGATPAELTVAAIRHREHWAATGRQAAYIPYPATWLRAESWTDDLHAPLPATPRQPQHERYADQGIF